MGKWQKHNTDLKALWAFLSFRVAVPVWGNKNINFAKTPEKVKVAVLECWSTGGWTAGILNRPIPCSRLSWNCCSCCSVAQLCPTLWPHGLQHPGLPVLYYLLKFAQIHVHWVDDAIQPSHPLSSPSPPALNLSQHQGLFQWVGSSRQVAKVLELWHQGMVGHLLSLSSEGTSCDWSTQAGTLPHSQSFPWGNTASGWEGVGFAKPVSWKLRTSSWAQTRQFHRQPLGEQGCACPRSCRLGKKGQSQSLPICSFSVKTGLVLIL